MCDAVRERTSDDVADFFAQVNVQLIAIGATIAYSFVVTAIILLVIKFTLKLEVSEEEERAGLDVSQHGEEAYMA